MIDCYQLMINRQSYPIHSVDLPERTETPPFANDDVIFCNPTHDIIDISALGVCVRVCTVCGRECKRPIEFFRYAVN